MKGSVMGGVIPNQQISDMINAGQITGDLPVDPAQIQPASLDLRIGTVAYRVRASFLAGHGAKVADLSLLHIFEATTQ